MTTEPILTLDSSRFVLFPIQHEDVWELYKAAKRADWSVEEVDLAPDLSDWKNLTGDERHFIESVLAFFASADGIVMENLAGRFATEVCLPEARCFYAFQMAIEAVHAEMYSLLLNTYVSDALHRASLFNAIDTMPCVKQKAEWALRWGIQRDGAEGPSFGHRLIAFACVEGIFFSGAFCAIFWLKKRGLMKGLTFSNEKISADEGLHCVHACMLYRKLEHDRPDPAPIVREAVAIEKEFVTSALPVSLLGMNAEAMGRYVEFVADRLMQDLGHPTIYGTANPFDWMELISLTGKTNFFERRVAEYAKAAPSPTVALAEDAFGGW